MRAVIVANGPAVDYGELRRIIREDDLLVIADGGIAHALALDLRPARVFGDFDSATPRDLAEAEQRGWPLVRVPREKDATDTELALAWARAQGASEIILAGATGGRLDHTLANVMLLVALAQEGMPARLVDGRHEARAMIGGELRLDGEPGTYLSLIPLTPKVTGVSIAGAKYELHNATLYLGGTLGVSNEFTGQPVSIRVESGILLVITARESISPSQAGE